MDHQLEEGKSMSINPFRNCITRTTVSNVMTMIDTTKTTKRLTKGSGRSKVSLSPWNCFYKRRGKGTTSFNQHLVEEVAFNGFDVL